MSNLAIVIVVIVLIILGLFGFYYVYSPDWNLPDLKGKQETPLQPTAKRVDKFSNNIFGLKYPEKK